MRGLGVVVIGILAAGVQAQQGPDLLIAASEQAAHADTLFASCRYDEAEQWLKHAIRNTRQMHSSSQLVRDTGGSLLGRLEIRLDGFHRQRKLYDREHLAIRRLLQAGRVEAARQRLQEPSAPAPECDPRFQELRAETERRRAQAAELIAKGDQQLRYAPGAALALYQQAQKLEADAPGLPQRMAQAHDLSRHPCYGCRKALKVILYTAIAGGLGYGGYYAYREYERQQQRAADSRAAGWRLR